MSLYGAGIVIAIVALVLVSSAAVHISHYETAINEEYLAYQSLESLSAIQLNYLQLANSRAGYWTDWNSTISAICASDNCIVSPLGNGTYAVSLKNYWYAVAIAKK